MLKNSFVAIDFETAIAHHICSVGIVTVEEGEIVEEFHTLIRPPNNEYNWRNVQVHGISERHTANSPNFQQIYPEIHNRLFGKMIVAHNESFDRNVLTKSLFENNLNFDDLNIASRWECTMKIYKAKGYKPARLSSCCEMHGIELQHHDALSDARACAKLFLLA
jgi:DNA polymerase-3 subunit epsilon